jgi:hypothetical protein
MKSFAAAAISRWLPSVMRSLSLQPKTFSGPLTRENQKMAHLDRGEVWLVDLGLAAKVRPCMVLSIPYEENDRSLVTAIAHPLSPRSARFEVSIKTGFLRSGAFDVQNIVAHVTHFPP